MTQPIEEITATPGLSAIIAMAGGSAEPTEGSVAAPLPSVEAQVVKAVAEQNIAITVTHVAQYFNENYPDTYHVEFEGELDSDMRQRLQRDSTRFPVVGLTWLVYKPAFPLGTGLEEAPAQQPPSVPTFSPAPDPQPAEIAPEQAATPPNEAAAPVDPRDARIADLERQIAELTAQRLASQPAIAEAIREEIRTFPAEPGTRYFVGDITEITNQRETAQKFDQFERDCDVLHEEFKAFDVGQLGKFWHVARGKRRSTPTENGSGAKTFAEMDAPEPAKEALRGKIVEPVGPVMSLFTNLIASNPLVEEVWRRGPDAVMQDILAEGNRLAVDFIFEHLAPRDTLALVEVDDLS